MKAAISLPDDLAREIDACAAKLKITRSRFLAVAARDFLARRRTSADATEAYNRVIDSIGQPGDDEAAVAFRRRTRAAVRRSSKPKRGSR